jgi:hypothetical protein
MRLAKSVIVVAPVVLLAVSAAAVHAQGGFGVRRPRPDTFNGAFTFCRLAVRADPYGDGGSWNVDYPRADVNLSTRLSELTRTRVNLDAAGRPNHVVLLATDPELFQCPLIVLTNPGRAYLSETDAAALRLYLQKGGFLWSDDSWGSYAWDHWVRELRKVLPATTDYPLIDLQIDHPIFRTLFEAKRIPQIPNIGFYHGNGGTSERGRDSAVPRVGAILDPNRRIVVLLTHNTDFGDAYERESEDPEFFYKFSVEGYAIGINILLYAMTH